MLSQRKFFIVLFISVSCVSVFYFIVHHTTIVDIAPNGYSLIVLPRFPKRNTKYAYNSSNAYLRLVNTIDPGSLLDEASPEVRNNMEDIIRRGRGLQPYTNERNESCWIENGIVYQPWRRPPASMRHPTHPSPYTSEYEPHVPFREDLFFEGRTPDLSYLTSPKIITWGMPTRYTQRRPGLQVMKTCPEFPCRMATESKYQEQSAAMIFTAQIIDFEPPRRRADQIFVLHNHEPPVPGDDKWNHEFRLPEWRAAFNWTMTYRMDSDFVVPYGIVRKRPKLLEGKNYTEVIKDKKKIAAWLVSNCYVTSGRNRYVQELQKYIDVDIYGFCGPLRCPHRHNDKCADIIAKQYKFYLSFESSYCSDYISEKLFHYLTMDTIVVARGENQYYKHLPSEIFINTANFPSPKALADRLIYLNEHDDAYIDMLREKDKYFSIVEGYPVRNDKEAIEFMAYNFETVSFCLMCQRLWNLDKYSKSITDIHKWFDSKMCYRPSRNV